jgi:hypothetical protein
MAGWVGHEVGLNCSGKLLHKLKSASANYRIFLQVAMFIHKNENQKREENENSSYDNPYFIF